MRVDIISIFPAMFEAFVHHGVVGRAVESGIAEFHIWNPRDYTQDRHRAVDDRPYGGGPGMVMLAQPLQDAIQAARADAGSRATAEAKVIYVSPQGRKLDHAGVLELARRETLILLAGRYEGVDERLLAAAVDEEWSIGDYVLSGGEPAIMVMMDAIIRQLPGVLGHPDSAQQDSFAGGLLDYGHYTRPENYNGQKVPPVLLSGDHEQIRRWRLKQSLGRTWLRRPDLLEKLQLDAEQQRLLVEFQQEYEVGVEK
jgi:tRNA (guanine37-N1)-methyltransferase